MRLSLPFADGFDIAFSRIANYSAKLVAQVRAIKYYNPFYTPAALSHSGLAPMEDSQP